ncbi:MAG: hypothetical protein A2X50_11305 [Candidatus Rokubacteria bacterium GWF2_70_14]|nr:MAG: hypothetical protein A2X53_04760 [Candidatus Rokubacteria bacterium GWA2_70_23]OGK91745.1 MAG: hypothetical protein A2X50_11305 [Candidatus Rokubacteria bacterium GWF2_70_14]
MRRVFGLETEYGFFCHVNGARLPARENVIRYVFEQTVPGVRNGGVFLENGGRFYLDSGYHRADWSCLKLVGGDARTMRWRDPLQAHDEETEQLMTAL